MSATATTASSVPPSLQGASANQESRAEKAPSLRELRYPLGYLASFSQWWGSAHSSAQRAEQRVLSTLPFYPASDGEHVGSSEMVRLSGRDRALNEFHVRPAHEGTPGERHHMVLLHGYGSGMGLYFRVMASMAKGLGRNWDFWYLDWLGMGRSSRPHFRIRSKGREAKIDETESFFIDALEEWRQLRKIDKFVFVGHSLGGYLGVEYARRYPQHVSQLVLVSPVGVPEYKEAAKSEPQPLKHVADPSIGANENIATDERLQAENAEQQYVFQRNKIPGWLAYLWDSHLSPFALVRMVGPFGPKLASSYTSRRFGALNPEEYECMHDYTYSTFRLRGSGEYALGYLLAPGAYARRPLIHRIGAVKCPVTFIYGDSDWMDKRGGEQACHILRRNGTESSLHIVAKAGHNVFLDNPGGFSTVMEDVFKKGNAVPNEPPETS